MAQSEKENMLGDFSRIISGTNFELTGVNAGCYYAVHKTVPITILPPQSNYGGETRIVVGNPKMIGDTPEKRIGYFTTIMKVRDELKRKGYIIPSEKFSKMAFPYGNFSGYEIKVKTDTPGNLEKIVKDCDLR